MLWLELCRCFSDVFLSSRPRIECPSCIFFWYYVCVCVFFHFILDIKFVGRTSRGHTGGRSHRISHPPSSFCGACLNFYVCALFFNKNQNVPRSSEHPPARGEKMLIVQAYRVRRSTSRYGLSHRDQSRRDVWMGVITPHFRDRCITPSWMTALGHFLSTPLSLVST